MKQQSVGVVLCALLLTTFGHEVLNRHLIARAARLAHHPQAKHHSLARENTEEHCVKICKPVDSNLTISINANASLVAVYNATAKVGLVLDVKAGLVGIFNLSTTGGVIFDLGTKSAVEVRGLWQVNVSWEVALRTLSSTGLRVLYGKGQSISTTKVEIVVQVALVVLSSGEYDVSAKESIGALIEISNSLVVSFKAVLVVIKSGSFSVKISLRRFVEIIGGLSNVIINIKGGVQVLIEHEITLSLDIILTANSSFEIAGYIWQQLAGADIEHIFGDLRNSSNVLKLIAGLGGNSTQGVNGLVTVLLEVILIVHGKGSAEKLIAVLIDYFSSNDHTVGEEWKASVSGLHKLIVRLNLTIKLKAVVELLVKIEQGKWVEENINISAIITALTTAKDNDGLNAIAVILVLLRARIAIELAIATLVLHFIELLAIQGGIQILVIVTGIQVGAQYLSGSASALVQILRGISLTDLISGGIRGFVNFLGRLAVVRDLIVRINAAFKAAGATQTVQVAFSWSLSIQIVTRIRTVIQGVLRPRPIVPIPIVGGPVKYPIITSGSQSATAATDASESAEESEGDGADSSSSSSNVAVGGGTGGDGGDGGDSSGNAGSIGNSGSVSGGGGSGNSVSVSGNSGGTVSQEGGDGGNGGNASGGTISEGHEDDRHKGKGKHAKHHQGKHHSNEKHQ